MASPEHIARRLRRLEWATRYRPVHIRVLLLGAAAPREDTDYLYSPGGEFRGEGGQLLGAVGIPTAGKATEAVQAEFQAAGFFLAHILECPVESGRSVEAGATSVEELLRKHFRSVASRIRRSLKPKSVILVTEMPQTLVQDMLSMDLGCPVLLHDGRPFSIGSAAKDPEISALRAVLDSRAMR